MDTIIEDKRSSRQHWDLIVERARDGDPAAEEELLLALKAHLERDAVRHGLRGADADDYVGEVLPTVYFSLRDYQPGRCHFLSWVSLRARDGLRAVNELRPSVRVPRSRGHRPNAECMSIDAPMAEHGESSSITLADTLGLSPEVFSSVDVDDRNALVGAALNGLAAEHRELIIWRFGLDDREPMTPEAIARKRGCSRQSISMKLGKVFEALRERPELAAALELIVQGAQ